MSLATTTIKNVGNVFIINKTLIKTTTSDVFEFRFQWLTNIHHKAVTGKPLEMSTEFGSILNNLPIGLRIIRTIFSFHISKGKRGR